MTDLGTLLGQARRPERTVPICMRGDLQAEFEDLERQLEKAQRTPQTKLVDSGDAARIATQIETLRDQMESSTAQFRVRGLPRPEWRALQGKFVKPDGGLDVEALASPLIQACTVEPAVSDEQWTLLFNETLTDAQYDQLFEACWLVNKRSVDVPFSRAASLIAQTSERS